uniref:Coactosin-like protein n=1 Tax=Junco hyemalis TaxID=40217 RepID=A0A8C5IML0_JUNHY
MQLGLPGSLRLSPASPGARGLAGMRDRSWAAPAARQGEIAALERGAPLAQRHGHTQRYTHRHTDRHTDTHTAPRTPGPAAAVTTQSHPGAAVRGRGRPERDASDAQPPLLRTALSLHPHLRAPIPAHLLLSALPAVFPARSPAPPRRRRPLHPGLCLLPPPGPQRPPQHRGAASTAAPGKSIPSAGKSIPGAGGCRAGRAEPRGPRAPVPGLLHHRGPPGGPGGAGPGRAEPLAAAAAGAGRARCAGPRSARLGSARLGSARLAERGAAAAAAAAPPAPRRSALSPLPFAPMATKIDKEACREAYNLVRDDATEVNWVTFKYNGSTIVPGDQGVDYETFKRKCTDDVRLFGFVRFTTGDAMSKRVKFALITWIGEDVSGLQRAKTGTDKTLVKEVVQNFAKEFVISDHKELDEDYIKNELKKAGGANYDAQTE